MCSGGVTWHKLVMLPKLFGLQRYAAYRGVMEGDSGGHIPLLTI